jgi:glycosyltransferase involved in cell wall biosynthesis
MASSIDNASTRPNALLSIVVAMHNEQEAIAFFFAELEKIVATLDVRVEYVCVNDGSRDATLAKLRDYQKTDPRIRVIDLARNFGKEAAMTAGLRYAKGDAAVLIDADLQDPPELIAGFIAKWREGFDVVYGVRSSRQSDTLLKRVTASLFYSLFNKITDVPIVHDAGDFRLLDRKVIDALLSLPERNRFMKGLYSWVGFRQTGIEFVRQKRVAGETSWNYPKLLSFAIDAFTGFSIVPLRIGSFLGLFVSLFGFCYALFLFARTLIYGVDVPGYASIMVAILFLGGIQLLCLGMIGEYIGRAYIETKGRPIYLVAHVYEDAAE